MDLFDIIVSILGSTIRLSIPLLFTALAGLFTERAGVFDIGLEGKMLAAAFASACVAYVTGNAWLGLLGGIGVSILFSLIHGFASITNRGNQMFRVWRSTSLQPVSPSCSARPGSGRVVARRNCRPAVAFRRSSFRVPTQCATCP